MGSGSGAVSILLIVAVLGGLLLFSGPIINAISQYTGGSGNVEIPGLTDIINQIRNALGWGNSGGNATGRFAVAFTVYFSDGTSLPINEDMNSFSIAGFSVSYAGNNKTITKIQCDVPAKMSDLTGTWQSSVTLQVELYKKPNTTPADSSTWTYTNSGASWASGDIKKLASTTIEAYQLESVFAAHGTGAYLLQVNANATLTTTVNGVSKTYTASQISGGLDIAGA